MSMKITLTHFIISYRENFLNPYLLCQEHYLTVNYLPRNWVEYVNISPKLPSISYSRTSAATEHAVVDCQQNRRMLYQPAIALQHTVPTVLFPHMDDLVGLLQN